MTWVLILILLVCQATAAAGSFEELYSNDGEYLGNTSSNTFDPNSVNNPYGTYGSPYSAKSIKNPYGDYGSQYSTRSPNNPYANPGKAIPSWGGTSRPYGGRGY